MEENDWGDIADEPKTAMLFTEGTADDGHPLLYIYDPDLWVILTVFAKMAPERMNQIADALNWIGIITADKPAARLVARFDDDEEGEA